MPGFGLFPYINSTDATILVDGDVYEIGATTVLYDENGDVVAVGKTDILGNGTDGALRTDDKIEEVVVEDGVVKSIKAAEKLQSVIEAEEGAYGDLVEDATEKVEALENAIDDEDLMDEELLLAAEEALEAAKTAVAKVDESELNERLATAEEAVENAREAYDEAVSTALETVENSGTIIGDLSSGIGFKEAIDVPEVIEGKYKIDVLITLDEALPAGTKVSVLGRDAVDVAGQSEFWLSELLGLEEPADFVNEDVTIWTFAVTGNEAAIDTEATVQSFISNDGFDTTILIAEADELAFTAAIDAVVDAVNAVNEATSQVTMRAALKQLEEAVADLTIEEDKLADVATHVYQTRPANGYADVQDILDAIDEIIGE